MGPSDFRKDLICLRTAVSVEPSGWAHFDYVKMPDYRWGIFLAPSTQDKRIGFGDYEGDPVWPEARKKNINYINEIGSPSWLAFVIHAKIKIRIRIGLRP